MDPRERADATLARARARGGYVVTPEDAVSPMDAANTMQIPRAVVRQADAREDPDPTVILRDGEGSTQPHPWRDATVTERQEHPLAAKTHTAELPSPTASATPEPRQGPTVEEQDGLVPTVTRAEGTRPNVAQRLDGRSNVTRRLDG
ncbi:MAG: hypothetical protein GEU98_16515 [Pseudonocardiaceae bacterium]|nr:hypothetical protein [Pseudonocardiaceae bacterium]